MLRSVVGQLATRRLRIASLATRRLHSNASVSFAGSQLQGHDLSS
jgi:hypothetical protein